MEVLNRQKALCMCVRLWHRGKGGTECGRKGDGGIAAHGGCREQGVSRSAMLGMRRRRQGPGTTRGSGVDKSKSGSEVWGLGRGNKGQRSALGDQQKDCREQIWKVRKVDNVWSYIICKALGKVDRIDLVVLLFFWRSPLEERSALTGVL